MSRTLCHLRCSCSLLAMVVAVAVLAGCKPRGPASTTTTSAGISTLAARVAFLQNYVTFRRTYETLDFNIAYQDNGGGMVPAPSDWDVRLIATVPADELGAWIPPTVQTAAAPDTAWIRSIPTSLDTSGVREWYIDGHRAVGLDRSKRIVVYRVSSH